MGKLFILGSSICIENQMEEIFIEKIIVQYTLN